MTSKPAEENRGDAPGASSKDAVPEQKAPDHHDKSAVGEEDPGAALEEMHDPHPDARPSPDKGRS